MGYKEYYQKQFFNYYKKFYEIKKEENKEFNKKYRNYLIEVDKDINKAYEEYLLKHILKDNKRFTAKQNLKNLKIQKIKLIEKSNEEKFMEDTDIDKEQKHKIKFYIVI